MINEVRLIEGHVSLYLSRCFFFSISSKVQMNELKILKSCWNQKFKLWSFDLNFRNKKKQVFVMHHPWYRKLDNLAFPLRNWTERTPAASGRNHCTNWTCWTTQQCYDYRYETDIFSQHRVRDIAKSSSEKISFDSWEFVRLVHKRRDNDHGMVLKKLSKARKS